MGFTTSLRNRLIRSSFIATAGGAAVFASCANGATSVDRLPVCRALGGDSLGSRGVLHQFPFSPPRLR